MRAFLSLIFSLALLAPVLGQPSWPPQVGQPYPDLNLVNQDGKKTKFSSFKGKVILVEPIGMNCPGCNAFAGGASKGGFAGTTPQRGLPDFRSLVSQYARVQLPNPEVVVVHLLLYDHKMGPPSSKDAKAWAEHFGLSTFSNEYVLAGGKKLQGQASYNMIPGFQLIDRDFRLLYDSSGHHPKHDLYRELLPALGRLIGR